MNAAKEELQTPILDPDAQLLMFKEFLPKERHAHHYKNYAAISNFAQTCSAYNDTVYQSDHLWKPFLPTVIASLGIIFYDLDVFLKELDARLQKATISYQKYIEVLVTSNIRTVLREITPSPQSAINDLLAFSEKIYNDPLINFLAAQLQVHAKQEYRLTKKVLENCQNIVNSAFLEVYHASSFTKHKSITTLEKLLNDKTLLEKVITECQKIVGYDVESEIILPRNYWLDAFHRNFTGTSKLLALTESKELPTDLDSLILLELSYAAEPHQLLKYFSEAEIHAFSGMFLKGNDAYQFEFSTGLGYVAQLNTKEFANFVKLYAFIKDESIFLKNEYRLKQCIKIHKYGKLELILKHTKDLSTHKNLTEKIIANYKLLISTAECLERATNKQHKQTILNEILNFSKNGLNLFGKNFKLLFLKPDLLKDQKLTNLPQGILKCLPEIKTIANEDEATFFWHILDKINNFEASYLIVHALIGKKITSAELIKCAQIMPVNRGNQSLFDLLLSSEKNYRKLIGKISKEKSLLSVLEETYKPSPSFSSYIYSFFSLEPAKSASLPAVKSPKSVDQASHSIDKDQLKHYLSEMEKITNKRRKCHEEVAKLDREEQYLRKNLELLLNNSKATFNTR